MSVSQTDATTLLENVLFELATLAAANAPLWVTASQSSDSESTVSGLAAAMAASTEASIPQQVVRYYEGALGRAPSGSEIQYYVNIVETGLTAAQIASGTAAVPQSAWNQIASDFANSPEFSFATAGTNIVTLLYQNILNRTPAASEIAYYQAQLANGLVNANLIQEFTNSPEFQSDVSANVADALADNGVALVAGTTLPIIPVTLPGQAVSATLDSSGDGVTLTGSGRTVTATVTGSPAASAQAARTAVTGVVGVTAVAAGTGVQPVTAVTAVTPVAAQSAVTAVSDGAATVVDAAYTSQGAGTLATVTLINSGAGSVIDDNALTHLSLTGTTGTLVINNNATKPSADSATLTLTLNGLSAAANAITDTNGEITTLNVTTATANSTLAAFNDANLTTLTVSGTNTLTLTTITPSLTSLSVTGGAGFSDGATQHGKGLSALGAKLTITDSASGPFSAALDDTSQTFTGGTGPDTILVSDRADATKTITAGTATVNEIIFEGGAYALTSASSGKFVNFQTVGVAGNVSGTLDLSVIDPTASTIELLGANAGVTFTKVATGQCDDRSLGRRHRHRHLCRPNRRQDTTTVVMSGAVTSLTLQDATAVGIGTVNMVNSLGSGETVVSGAHVLGTLTDNGLATLNVSGSAGLSIGTLNQATTPATSLTLNNSSTDFYGFDDRRPDRQRARRPGVCRHRGDHRHHSGG